MFRQKFFVLAMLTVACHTVLGWQTQNISNPHVRSLIGSTKLNSDNPSDRAAAALTLKNMQEEAVEAIPYLQKRLEIEADESVRPTLIEAIGSLGKLLPVDQLKPLVPLLCQLTVASETHGFEQRFIRRKAVIALGRIGTASLDQIKDQPIYDEMVGALDGALTDSCRMVSKFAVQSLAHMNARKSLIKAAQPSPDISVEARRLAIQELGTIMPPSQETMRTLIANLGDREDGSVRVLSANALGNMETYAVPLLIDALDSKAPHVVCKAAEALGAIGADAAPACDKLITILTDQTEKDSNRFMAAEALGNIGPKAEKALPYLIEVLDQERGADNQIRWYAISSLGQIAGPLPVDKQKRDVLQALQAALASSTDAGESARIAQAVGAFGPFAAVAVEQLAKKVNPNTPKASLAALDALAKLGPKAVPTLKRLASLESYPSVAHPGSGQGNFGGSIGVWSHSLIYQNAAILRGKALIALAAVENGGDERYPFIQSRLTIDQAGALEALGILNDPRAIGDLEAYLGFTDSAGPTLTRLLAGLPSRLPDLSYETLQQVKNDLESFAKENRSQLHEKVLKQVNTELGNRHFHKLIGLLKTENGSLRIAVIAAIYLLFWSLLWSLIFLIRPLWIHQAGQVLKPISIKIPWLGGMCLSLGTLTLVTFFHYTKRVISRWVAHHLPAAHATFIRKHNAMAFALPPLSLENGKYVITDPGMLKQEFSNPCYHLFVLGEDAADRRQIVRTLAFWGMAQDPQQQICQHAMIPVIFDKPFKVEDHQQFLEMVRAKLRWRVNMETPIDPSLFKHLLLQRRVMVLIEDFADLEEPTRDAILSSGADSPLNTMILTADRKVTLDERPFVTIRSAEAPRTALTQYVAYLNRSAETTEYADDQVLLDAGKLAGSLSKLLLQGETPTSMHLIRPLGGGPEANWKLHYFRERLGIISGGKGKALTFSSKTLLCYLAVYDALRWEPVNDASIRALIDEVVRCLAAISDPVKRYHAVEVGLMVLDSINHVIGDHEAVLPATRTSLQHYFRILFTWLNSGNHGQAIELMNDQSRSA